MAPPSVRVTEDAVYTSTPYNEEFVLAARALRGKWEPETSEWRFHLAQENEVRAALLMHYGSDGEHTSGYVDVAVVCGPDGIDVATSQVVLFGETRVRKYYRDSPPVFANGTSLLSGPPFPKKLGSNRHPACGDNETRRELLISQVPLPAALKAVNEHPKTYRIVGALREALVARITALRTELNKLEAQLEAHDRETKI